MPFDGFALGGLWVGEGRTLGAGDGGARLFAIPGRQAALPDGSRHPVDLVECVARGVDMMDCVLPTRAGRHGLAYTWAGKVNLKNARHADDPSPLDAASTCAAARDYSRAYLHHLVKSEEYLGAMVLSWANVAFYQQLMDAMRTAIAEDRFVAWAAETKARFGGGTGSNP